MVIILLKHFFQSYFTLMALTQKHNRLLLLMSYPRLDNSHEEVNWFVSSVHQASGLTAVHLLLVVPLV